MNGDVSSHGALKDIQVQKQSACVCGSSAVFHKRQVSKVLYKQKNDNLFMFCHLGFSVYFTQPPICSLSLLMMHSGSAGHYCFFFNVHSGAAETSYQ